MKKKIIITILGLIIIALILFCINLSSKNKIIIISLNETQIEYSKLFNKHATLTNEYDSLKNKYEQLKLNHSNLNSNFNNLNSNLSELQTEHSSLNDRFELIELEIVKSLDKLIDFEKKVNQSREWFSSNINLDQTNKYAEVKKSLKEECITIEENECQISFECIDRKNLLHHLTYRTDFYSTGSRDKLLDLDTIYNNKGGDCEDISLLFRAEYNWLVDQCKLQVDEENIKVITGKNFDELIVPANYMYVICGRFKTKSGGWAGGHCMVALIDKPITSTHNLNNALKNSIVYEPQTGKFEFFLNDTDRTVLIEEGDKRKTNFFIWEIVTNDDLKIFYHNDEIIKWTGYSDFYEDIQDLKIKLHDEDYSDPIIKFDKSKYIDYNTLILEINKTLKEDYIFKDLNVKRENHTGIEDSFIVYDSTPSNIRIIKFKQEYNYNFDETNFYIFIKKRYDSVLQDYKIGGPSTIEYYGFFNPTWKKAFSDETHNLNLIENNIYFENHLLVFIQPQDNALNAWRDVKLIVECTPELFVEVYPYQDSEMGWGSGSGSDIKSTVLAENERYKNELLPIAQSIRDICIGEI